MASTEAVESTPPHVAVVGAGGWGRNLVRNLHELGALHTIADIDPGHRRAMSEAYPEVGVTADMAAILQDPDIEAVIIATPVGTHHALVQQALEAGKDVFVEKPLTLSGEEAWQLVALAEQRERLLMVGHLLLFQPAIHWLRDFLAAGRIGQVHSVHQERLGLGRARGYENALWCLGTHDVAVQRFLLPGHTPQQMSVHGQCMLQPGVEDDVHLHLSHDTGLETHLHCSWLWPQKRRVLVIVGSEGMVEYDELRQVIIHHHKGIDGSLENIDQGAEEVFEGHDQPLRLELEHFLARVRDRAPSTSDGYFAATLVDLLAKAETRLRNTENG